MSRLLRLQGPGCLLLQAGAEGDELGLDTVRLLGLALLEPAAGEEELLLLALELGGPGLKLR